MSKSKSSTVTSSTQSFRYKSGTSTAKIKSLMKADEQLEAMIVVPPDGGWGWVVVFAAFYCNFVNDGISLSFGVFLETFVTEFNATKASISFSSSVFSGCYFLLGPVISGLANRYGFRSCAIIGGLLSGAGYLLTSLDFVTLPMMYLFHGCMGGTGAGFIFIPAVLTVGFYFEKWRAVATGIAVSASGFGTIIWPIIINKLLERYQWRTVLRFIGVVQASCAIAGLFFRPLKPKKVVMDAKKTMDYSMSITALQQLRDRKSNVCYRCWRRCRFFRLCKNNRNYPTAIQILDPKKESILVLANATRMSTYSIESEVETMSMRYYPSRRTVSLASKDTVTGILRPLREESFINCIEEEHVSCCGKFEAIVVERFCCCCKNNDGDLTAQRPFYRDDIFFQASLLRLPEYITCAQDEENCKSIEPGTSKKEISIKKKPKTEYHASVSRVATQRDVQYEQYTCRICPQAITRVIGTMLDFSLMTSPSFMLLSLSSFITLFGIPIPYVFFASRGEDHKLSVKEAAWQLSLIGISNTIGRIVCGFSTSIPKLNIFLISYSSLMICGAILMVNEFYDTKTMQYCAALGYGFFISSMASLKPLIVVELLSLDRLTNAFGLLMVFQGLGSLCGIPLAGILRDSTGSYFATFLFAGLSIFIGGVLLLPLKTLKKWETLKKPLPQL